LIRVRDSELRLRFQNPHRRDPHVVVAGQRASDQILERLVLKHLPPSLVAE
jgi:hypothetical protein